MFHHIEIHPVTPSGSFCSAVCSCGFRSRAVSYLAAIELGKFHVNHYR